MAQFKTQDKELVNKLQGLGLKVIDVKANLGGRSAEPKTFTFAETEEAINACLRGDKPVEAKKAEETVSPRKKLFHKKR